MDRENLHPVNVTRRHFFEECGVGVGKMALASLLGEAIAPAAWCARASGASLDPSSLLAPRSPHFAPKAKRVIHLFMAGGAEST